MLSIDAVLAATPAVLASTSVYPDGILLSEGNELNPELGLGGLSTDVASGTVQELEPEYQRVDRPQLRR